MNERIYSIYASTLSIIGFIFQLTSINEHIKNVLFAISIISLISILVVCLVSNNTVRRKKLIKFGNRILLNTKEKAILFGGDMSWVDDYIDSISRLNKENKTIEIFFPESKLENSEVDNNSNNDVQIRIKKLKKVGAKVYSFKEDFGLRCILIDPDTYNSNEDMEIMITDRISTNKKNTLKNKYTFRHLKFKNNTQKNICKSYISNYAYVKQNCISR